MSNALSALDPSAPLKAQIRELDIHQPDIDYSAGDPRAIFIRQATPGTTYWRGYVPMSALPGKVQTIKPEYLEVLNPDPTALEIAIKGITHLEPRPIIWQFLGDEKRSRIAAQMLNQGWPAIQEMDDNYIDTLPNNMYSTWARTKQEASVKGGGYSNEAFREVTTWMDGVICATPFLADRVSEFNPNVWVCRNSVKPSDWNVPDRRNPDVLTIGYYGSPSHLADWKYVKKAFKWASRQKDVQVKVIGFSPPTFSGEVVKWADNLEEARNNLGLLDVGVAPLNGNRWSRGKSDIKAMEYAMAGVMPILQNEEPFAPWRPFWGRWMPSTEDEWMDCIKWVVKNRDSVKEWADAAKRYVLEERTIDKEVERWEEAIRDVT